MAQMKLKDQVYEKVLNDITAGVYQANQIITERELIEKYGVSKSPVREALVALCNENILESRPRMGYFVRAISLKDVSDIVELRVILETAALKKTFPGLTNIQIERLKEEYNNAKVIHEGKSVVQHWQHNNRFHLLLCSFCGNAQIYSSLERAMKLSFCGAVQYFSASWTNHIDTKGQRHIELIHALENKDLEQSTDILAKDIEDLKRGILDEYN